MWCGDVPAALPGWLAQLDAPVDLAFVDPPYPTSRRWAEGGWSGPGRDVLEALAGRLAADGRLALRTDARSAPPAGIAGLATDRVRRYGDMAVVLLAPAERGEP